MDSHKAAKPFFIITLNEQQPSGILFHLIVVVHNIIYKYFRDDAPRCDDFNTAQIC